MIAGCKYARRALSDLVWFQEGPGLRNWQWAPAGIKVINGTNVRRDDHFDPSNTDKMIDWEEFREKYQHFEIQAGDIVVSSSGTIGKVARVGPEHLPMMMNTSVIRFRSRDADELDQDYLYAWLRSRDFKDQAEAYAHGAAQRNFGPSHLRLMNIATPPMKKQRRIASILGAYDNLIEVNRRRVAVLEEMARGLFEEWFVRFRFPGHESVPIVDTSDGPLPEGWSFEAFKSVAVLRSGFAFKSSTFVEEGKYSLVTIKHVHDGQLLPPFHSKLNVLPGNMPVHCHIATGDILLSLTGNVGRTCLAWGENLLLNQRVATVEWQRPDLRAFSYCWLRYPTTLRRLQQISNGVAQQNLSPIQTMELQLAVPPSHLSHAFETVAGPMLDAIVNDFASVSVLKIQRDLLLPRLISGQLSVEAAGRELEAAA